jgi:ParB family transcriptional regulator, chromosome partitioning protein
MNTTFEIVNIPLNKLVASPLNVRKTGGQTIDDLAASIRAHGLLHNLVVTKAKGDKHQVIAGGRRLAALVKLAKDKVIPKTMDVPCRIVEVEESTETSLAENVIRENMHPADQFDAFRLMIDQGAGPEEVAARFGVSVTSVRQRLKLAKVSSQLLTLYRAGEITLDQLMALAVTDDHAAQERVWAAAPGWQRNPEALRRVLTETMVDAARDPRARFVGIEAYINAGGQIERDLFQPEHEGYLTDPAILEELAVKKLEEVAQEVRGEGWLWVEILPSSQYPDLGKFGRLPMVYVPMAPEVRVEIEALEKEHEQLLAAHEDCEEYPKEVEERISAIEDRLDELNDPNDRSEVYREKDKKFAGAVVSLGNNGEPSICRGLVRAEDKKRMRASTPGNNGENPGRTQGDEGDESTLSAALVEDLTAHRTAALRVVLAHRPDVALVAVAHSLALRVCYERLSSYEVGSALSLTSEKGGCQLDSHAKGIATSIPSLKLEEVRSGWLSRIPAQPQDLWQWLLSQEQAAVIDFLAFCVGQTVHAVRLNHYRQSDPCLVAADRLAEAVDLDMADWWKVTGESYLGRVKKEQILAAIEQGTGETNLEALRKLKKSELVATAEARLAETRWLPEILRR